MGKGVEIEREMGKGVEIGERWGRMEIEREMGKGVEIERERWGRKWRLRGRRGREWRSMGGREIGKLDTGCNMGPVTGQEQD